MKSLIALLLSAALAAANPLIVISGAPPPAGAAAAWYDSVDEATTDGTIDMENAAAWGAEITPSSSGNCTKLRVRIGEFYGTTDIKIAIFEADGDTLGVAAGATVAAGGADWYEVTLSSPVAVTASTTYVVLAITNQNHFSIIRKLAGPDGKYTVDFDYATFASGTASLLTYPATQYCVGMYVE